MSRLKELISKATPTDWLTEGLTDEEVRQAIEEGRKQALSLRPKESKEEKHETA